MSNSCQQIQIDIPDYLDATLSTSRKDIVRKHLETCSDCQEYLEFLQDTRDEVTALPLPEHGDRYWEGLREKIYHRISRLENTEISASRFLSWLIPRTIPRWAYVGIGVATVILLFVTGVFQNNSVNEQETALATMDNPLVEPWVSEDTAIFQAIVNEETVPATFTDFVLEDTVSESSYLQVLEDDPFYFMSLLNEEDSQEFLDYL